MSLARLALRLAAFETLCPYASRNPAPQTAVSWPTLAGPNVYDSRLDPIAGADLAAIENKPIVILYTEESEVDPYSGEYPADREFAELACEIRIVSPGSVNVIGPDGSVVSVGSSITDSMLEAYLDVLEAQVRQALSIENPLATALLAVASELHHVKSVPFRDSEKGVRLAARTLTMKYRVNKAVWAAPGTSLGTGLAALPKPLSTVANLLNPASPHRLMLVKLAALIAPPVPLTSLTDIRILADVDRGQAPTEPDGSDSDVEGDVPLSGA